MIKNTKMQEGWSKIDLQKRMEAKMTEITEAEAERESLFEDFENNKARIAESYYEVEKLRLEYLILKREQLNASRIYENRKVVLESLDNVEQINETCILILQKKLTDAGWIPPDDKEGMIEYGEQT
ncbi:hypothetical protein J41TS12_41470 [Paenibacillus antibioticophila]|uniref:Uncharacterized protein n=1 Tax=Paenibacillus antibioticophila TaxID=1274374 RepID=A0A919XVM4_9BACL|nr:hypothetical protein [Paenibacillus antibioticophila]GIO39286.1 hypothetical protein J41TS12_41470 [Paenibacillus antibioticophila]